MIIINNYYRYKAMAQFSIESNGRLEKTAVYYNGEQIGGIKEIFINLDEDGTFDGIIQYEGSDKKIHTKQIFSEYLENAKISEPTFTEEEAMALKLFTIDSDGDIEDTEILLNDEPLDGVVNIMLHIKGAETKKGIKAYFDKSNIPDHIEFKDEITYRNEDDSLETEGIF